MNVLEWRDELQRLRRPPGPSLAELSWRSWLYDNRQPHIRYRECARAVRQMLPVERAAYNEGRSLGRDAKALRIGRREWLVLSPNVDKPADPYAPR